MLSLIGMGMGNLVRDCRGYFPNLPLDYSLMHYSSTKKRSYGNTLARSSILFVFGFLVYLLPSPSFRDPLQLPPLTAILDPQPCTIHLAFYHISETTNVCTYI